MRHILGTQWSRREIGTKDWSGILELTPGDFATMPPFHNYANLYGKFYVENIFLSIQTRMDKKYPEKCSFDNKLNFVKKKKDFFLQNFCDFWVFLKFRSILAKFETAAWFVNIFWTFLIPIVPLGLLCIEMGNLDDKTPCVELDTGNKTLHQPRSRFGLNFL